MRKKCRRKIYAKVDPIQYAIENASIASRKELDALRLIELTSIQAFADGNATLTDYRSLAEIGSVCEEFTKAGVGREAIPAIRRHEAAMLQIAKRCESSGKLTASIEEIQAFRDMFQYYDEQRQLVSRSEYKATIMRVINREKSGSYDLADRIMKQGEQNG